MIEIIDILKPKNGGSFKLIDAIDVAIEGYTSLADCVSHMATTAMIEAINAALSGKQDKLTTEQLAACNSGITSELVTQIGTNTTAIEGKADATDLATTNATVATKASSADLTTATANLQAQIDNIVSGSTSDAEVINARVGLDGTSYNTLKARCDATDTNVNKLDDKLLTGYETWTSITNGDVNGAGTFESNTSLITGLIPVKKGWRIKITTGSLVNRVFLWNGTVSSANCYLSSSARDTDYEVEVTYDGYACIKFAFDPAATITPSDFDGAVDLINTFFSSVLTLQSTCESLNTRVTANATAIANLEKSLLNGYNVWDDIENGGVNGAGTFSSATSLITGIIPVKKGWKIKVKTGSLTNRIFLWKNSVSAENCYLSSTAKSTDYSADVTYDGYACVMFAFDPASTISPTDYDGEVDIINTFYNTVVNDLSVVDTTVSNVKKDLSAAETELYGQRQDIPLIFELGGINTATGQETTSTNRARSNMFYLYKSMRVAVTDDNFGFRPVKYSADGSTCLGSLVNSNVSEYQLDAGYSYRILVFPENGITDFTSYITDINNNILCKLKKSVYVVAKDGTGDFSDVQHCLDFIHKTEPTTIMIKAGTYDKISTLTQKKYVDITTGNTNVKWYNRKVNLIGISEKDCIIKSDTGEYYTPAAEICITGEVRNLTFISTHENPPQDRSSDTRYLEHKAYAVHSDFGTENALYRNCTFISYQAPAVGIGGAANKHMRFANCHFYSYAPSEGEYAVLKDYGAFFYHLQAADGITGQNLELENCYMFSENGNKATWITVSTATNYGQETHLRGNCFYGTVCSKTVSIDSAMLSGDCFGNNAAAANAAV